MSLPATASEFEEAVRQVASQCAFIQWVHTLDRTEYAVKMRLHVDAECFVQVYANVQKSLVSFALVLARTRIYGRDCDGGAWHRHPYQAAEQHDFSPTGSQAVTVDEFLAEVQQILQTEGIL